MKYLVETLKYIKSNLFLLIAYAVAAACLAAVIDLGSLNNVIQYFPDDVSQITLLQWLSLFLPVNSMSWWSVLFSLIAYVLLALDLAFICALADRHMRYNSLSPRGLFSSINNNILPCAFIVLVLLILCGIISVLLAAIMAATASAATKLYILGIILCAVLVLVIFYVLTFFSLWLPCFTITGFRAYESLSYAYSLGAQRRKSLFIAIFVPVLIIAVCAALVAFFVNDVVAHIVIPLLLATVVIYIPVLCYVVYIDADGITREDLKKF